MSVIGREFQSRFRFFMYVEQTCSASGIANTFSAGHCKALIE